MEFTRIPPSPKPGSDVRKTRTYRAAGPAFDTQVYWTLVNDNAVWWGDTYHNEQRTYMHTPLDSEAQLLGTAKAAILISVTKQPPRVIPKYMRSTDQASGLLRKRRNPEPLQRFTDGISTETVQCWETATTVIESILLISIVAITYHNMRAKYQAQTPCLRGRSDLSD